MAPATLTPTEQTEEIAGRRLHWLDWSEHIFPPVIGGLRGRPEDAVPLVLLHGLTSHSHVWDSMVATFAESYHVLALDLRGHGDSGWADPPAYGYADYAGDLAAWLDHLALPPVVLLGHSMGGYVGAVYAAQHPARVRALILMDVLTEIPPEELAAGHKRAQQPQREYATLDELLGRFSLGETGASPELLRALGKQSAHQLANGRWALKFDRRVLAYAPIDWGVVDHLQVPTLVLRGEHSPLMPRAAARQIAERIPQGQFAEVAAAGHYVFLDSPTGFARAVHEFLAEVA